MGYSEQKNKKNLMFLCRFFFFAHFLNFFQVQSSKNRPFNFMFAFEVSCGQQQSKTLIQDFVSLINVQMLIEENKCKSIKI